MEDNPGIPIRFWYEYLQTKFGKLNAGVSVQRIGSIALAPGDNVYVNISFEAAAGKFNYYVERLSTGEKTSNSLPISTASFYDGTSAETITERETDQFGTLTPLRQHGYVNYTGFQIQNNAGSWYGAQTQQGAYIDMYNGSARLEASQPFTSTTNFSTHWIGCQ